jgi:hypothetical protein
MKKIYLPFDSLRMAGGEDGRRQRLNFEVKITYHDDMFPKR